ncbi:putative Protein arginine n-methyltransferase [Zostera marina]|uniref:Protein arginine N-methyltransferase domain-containing protein n=1 Tax=Zostera marina TaxID=29655 RepID=A0A0K9NLI7_ZOSMR|nr:putative Protein arginine n-methyltransferase [Zostera marina]
MRKFLLYKPYQILNLPQRISLPQSLLIPVSTIFFNRISLTSPVMSTCAFQLKLDPLTGNSEWIVVEEQDEQDEVVGNNQNTFLATTSYLDMLNDTYRNMAYRRAIENTITEPCHVIDIGAGTGLLSMMAARVMDEVSGSEVEDGRNVTAFESYLPMGKLMRKVLKENAMEKKIRIVHKRSDEVEMGVDIHSPAYVMVSEILDSELLGEGLIPSLQHAHDVLLVKNPKTVPYRATIYGQLVESSFLQKLHDLYSCEVEVSDGLHLVPFGSKRILGIKPKQYAMQCSAMSKEIKLLSEPFRIFEFEFSKRPESQREIDLHINTTKDGVIHAIISWWVLQLDSTGHIFYSTAPEWIQSSKNQESQPHISGFQNWCDHWKQCVWFVPEIGSLTLRDTNVHLQAIQNITSISFRLKSNAGIEESYHENNNAGNYKINLLPERIGIYGDKDYRTAFLTAARNTLQAGDFRFCLVVDDSVFLTIVLAHLSKTAQIISIFPGLKEKASAYLDSVANANDIANGRIEVLGKRVSSLSLNDLHGEKVDMIIAEPFYYGNEGALPWQNLRFWKERTLLDPLLSEDVRIMPCKGILKACAMSLPDLWRSRMSLNDIEGFDHSCSNEMLGACGNLHPTLNGPCLPYFVWQCGVIEELSEASLIMEFDFSEPIRHCFGKTKIVFTESGVCHGFVFWIDWVLDKRNLTVISTGPVSRYWKQGVKLLSKPVAVNPTSSSCRKDEISYTEIDASFNPTTGELDIKCNLNHSQIW